jgi:hypothetical protein
MADPGEESAVTFIAAKGLPPVPHEMTPGPSVATIGEEAPSCAGNVEGSTGFPRVGDSVFSSGLELLQAGRGKSRDLPDDCGRPCR